jgi:hypothetical protein
MKKQLLFGLAAFTALAVTAQNAHRVITNPKIKKMVTTKPVYMEPANTNFSNAVPSNLNKPTAAPYKRIGGSTNIFGLLSTETRALTYNEAINTTGMTFRKQAGWTGVSGGNSGTIAYAYSTNPSVAWDSTIIVAHPTNLQRYPTGSIYNPAGNTNPTNAYAVVSGPLLIGGTIWQGGFFGSKQLTTPGSDLAGNLVYSDNLALQANQRKQDFPRNSMQITSDGIAHVLGDIAANVNDVSSNAAYGWRGAMLNYGTFNAGAFTWTVDSLKPNFKLDGIGDSQGFSTYNHAWSENGQIGYVIFCGVDANAQAGTSANTFQPYVYKTTNAGASWARFAPLFDFASIPAIGDRTYLANNGVAKPFVSLSEGSSATVDASGNLHFLATFGSSSSDDIDSLGYSYSANFNNVWNYITDFNTTANGEWCAFVIDSLNTDGPAAAESNWTSAGSGLAFDARIQISRTTNGTKLVYSWADSDTTITGTHFNTQPNIRMKAYDLATNLMTATKDMSAGKAGADYNSFWFYASPIIANPTTGTWLVPTSYAVSDDGTLNGEAAVSYYYMDDNTFATADFTTLFVGGCTPTGIKNNFSTELENMTFYPNPASTNGTIDVQLNETANLDITVLNAVGQSVYSTSVAGNIGSNKVNINLNSLAAGLYFYQVKVGNSKAITKKFAVEK